MICLEQVTKLYGPVIGVNDISLTLEPGAYGILGPNGSGKSTLLNLITGQLRPTLGSITVLGDQPWNNAWLLRSIGVCPEIDMLYSNVSGLDWVTYLMELHGLSRAESKRRAREKLDCVGMSHAMQRPMGTYSRGMRQRTKLAQALAHDPDLLVLDEPFNGLDPVGRHDLTVLLRDWCRDGRSLLLASHILHEIEAITGSFLLVCGGRLLASGSAQDVHELLAEVPSEISIQCNQASHLARRILSEDSVEAVRFEGSERFVVTTRNPRVIYDRLPAWSHDDGIHIQEIRSTDDSLQTLFDSLMRIHKGET